MARTHRTAAILLFLLSLFGSAGRDVDSARMIHERFCCNRRSAATTSLRPAGSPLRPSTYCTSTHRVLTAPRAGLATRLRDFATNRHELCGLGVRHGWSHDDHIVAISLLSILHPGSLHLISRPTWQFGHRSVEPPRLAESSGVDVRCFVHASHGTKRVSTPSGGAIQNGRNDTWERERRSEPLYAPWHFLYFFPLPQGQGSLRPTLLSLR